MLIFYGDELLASRPRSMLEDYLLSAVRDSCFRTFTDAFHIRTPSPPSTTRVRVLSNSAFVIGCRLRLKCNGTCAETRFRLSRKRTSPLKSEGASVQSTTCSRGVRISGSNAGYTMFRGSVKGTGYPLHSPFSPSLPLPASPCAITFQLDSTNLDLRSRRV